MQNILMCVYGNIMTDARVNRAAVTLSKDHNITVISNGKQIHVNDVKYKNIILNIESGGIVNFLRYIFKVYEYILKERPDVVYAHDYYTSILIWILKIRRFKTIYIYDSHELIIPDRKINRRLMFFYYFEKKIIKKLNLLICTSQARSDIMKKHYNLSYTPIVIRNVSMLNTNKYNEILQQHPYLNDFFSKPGITIVYSGVISSNRCISKLIKAAALMTPKYKVLIIGDGDDLKNLKSLSGNFPNLTIEFTGTIPHQYLGSILSKCDIGFIYYPVDHQNNIFCASNKVFEYTSVNLPIVANNNPTIRKELEYNGIGIANDDILTCIKEVCGKIDTFKKNITEYNKKNTWEKESFLLLKCINEVINTYKNE